MRLRSVNDYEPDAEMDDGPPEAMPTSGARLRLAKLLRERSEAQDAMQSARDAIGRLSAYVNAPGPIESQIGELDSFEAELIARPALHSRRGRGAFGLVRSRPAKIIHDRESFRG